MTKSLSKDSPVSPKPAVLRRYELMTYLIVCPEWHYSRILLVNQPFDDEVSGIVGPHISMKISIFFSV